ncbi:hypothetical protein AAVH_40009, partial [Aphelenchoides avenae]
MPDPYECLKRIDRGKRLDDPGNAAPKELLPADKDILRVVVPVIFAVFLVILGIAIILTTPTED